MYRAFIIGNPLESETHVGPIINAEAVDKYRTLMASIQANEGCEVCGGQVLDVPGNYVEPTLVRVEPGLDYSMKHFYPYYSSCLY